MPRNLGATDDDDDDNSDLCRSAKLLNAFVKLVEEGPGAVVAEVTGVPGGWLVGHWGPRGTMCQIKHSLFPVLVVVVIVASSFFSRSPSHHLVCELCCRVLNGLCFRFNANNDCDNNGLRN